MCFSAPASFVAGVGLLLVGSAAVVKSKTVPQYVLSSIPILFAVQQSLEGVVWLGLSDPAYAHWLPWAIYLFLGFAQLVWPILVPLAILLFEKEPVRRKFLLVFLGIGILTAAYLGYALLNFEATAKIQEHHIQYALQFPFQSMLLRGIPYMLATAVSPFFSSHKQLRLLGWVLVGSYIFTALIYWQYLTSVWCYFGALLSSLILFIIIKLNKEVEIR
ncbi:MAG: DUF6629 family protein [Pedobacter sp.]|jgi:hypothetical protein|uniref:DUF6629 family protein n=1 Tax=Pedobacter sp. TaxID=1411316 RepID=UPI00356A9E00